MGEPGVRPTAKTKFAPNMQAWELVAETFAVGTNFVDPGPISSIKEGTVTQALTNLTMSWPFQDGSALPCSARC